MLSPEQRENTEMLAVSVDEREDQQKMIDRVSADDGMLIEYQLLADPDHAVIDRYGIFNPDSRRPIPHPTVFVIDKQGVVHWKFIEIDYRIRPTNDDILTAVAELD
ncbi:MAG: redoxin domain-containing protein [Gemmatimonadetes bacterium]|nr:redoxin domain-containing protein [Gemmatimonadota bacterium]